MKKQISKVQGTLAYMQQCLVSNNQKLSCAFFLIFRTCQVSKLETYYDETNLIIPNEIEAKGVCLLYLFSRAPVFL